MPETVILYHNNRCSKSRAALSLLQLRGLKTKVVHYLDTPPDADELKQLYRRLKLDSPRGMMRTKDALYRELALDNPALSDEALIAAMAEPPALIERPIAVFGQQAAIGRPELYPRLFAAAGRGRWCRRCRFGWRFCPS